MAVKEDKEYKDKVKAKAQSLDDEIEDNISEFMQTAADLREKTAIRKKALDKIKKKYKHIVKKNNHL